MQKTPQHERRQHPRKSASFDIKIQFHHQTDSQYVELRDISEGGMSFMVDNLVDYHEAQQLHVSIPQYNDNGSLEYQQVQAEIACLQEQDLLSPRAWVQGNRIKIMSRHLLKIMIILTALGQFH